MPRAKKDQKQKELQGTARPDREKGNQPEYKVLGKMPKPPESLNEHGKAFWKEIGAQLIEQRILTSVDLKSFGACCQHYGFAEDAAEDLSERGTLVQGERGMVKNPANQIHLQHSIQFRQYCDRFGIDPVSRAKVAGVPKEVEKTGIVGLVKKAG